MASTAPEKSGAKQLLLVDGSALLYRSHFAFARNPLRNSKGEITSAVFGYLNTLLPLLDERRPDKVAVVFDTKGPTFRHREYAEYKAHRPPMPDDLARQIPKIREMLRLLGVPIVEQEGVEADDILGTLAVEAAREGVDVWILTSDKDFYQIVTDRIRLLSPRGRGESVETIDRVAVRAKFGVDPEQMVDLLALMGDAVDNVPGVPGVGEKTATQLIATYGSLEELYRSVDGVARPALREKIRENEGKARLSRMLVTVRTDLPLDFHWHELERTASDLPELVRALEELEFRTLVKRFAGELEVMEPTELFPEFVSAPEPETPPARVLAPERPPLGDYKIVRTPEDLESLAAALHDALDYVAFDTETTRLDPMRGNLVGVSVALEPGRAYYIPVGHEAGGNADADLVRRALRPFFADPSKKRVAQNAKYDWHVLHRFGIPVHDITLDTMLAASLVAPDKPKNIDYLASTHLGIEKIPTQSLIGAGRDQVTMAAVPIERIAEYCSEDSDVCLRLTPILTQELDRSGILPLCRDVEMPLVGVLVRMERAGVKIDVPALNAMSKDLGERCVKLESEIQDAAGVPFNVNSPRQVAEILFDRLKLPKGRRTKDGYSTDVEVLESLTPLHPLPGLLLQHRQYQKLKSTYLDALPRFVNPSTGRVHATFHQTAASTGRLSASEPSLQNIPIRSEEGRAIRKAFIAEGTGLLVSFDYSQVELRLMAHLSGDPVLAESFRAGEDVHRTTAARLFGVAAEEVTQAQRAQAKIVNFGILYGMGPVRLARELNLSRALATAFIEEYRRTLSGVAGYLDESVHRARERGYAETILGRRWPLPALHEEGARRAEAERVAVNMPIQGSAADLIKVAMVRIDALLTQHPEMKSRLILQVHDELLFEAPEEEFEALKSLVMGAMEQAIPLKVPLEVHVGHGRSWADAHA
ncbi:MAG TPA: DNA polymerase I [Candidatus Limnocylindrales bacterium]|nr:DNA polymerase I [Candidatus Limnocylindrales bacterium]